MDYDFSGYATKNDLKCADGRIIRHDAFKENDGKIVPLVWQHVHDDPTNVLGHALLENREDGVYAYGTFNKTPSGKHAKEMVKNGDISSLSIFANRLQQNGSDVVHGVIREVSLVMAGANPGAMIDNVSFAHSDGSIVESEEEAVIFSGVEGLENLEHSDTEEDKKQENKTDETDKDDVKTEDVKVDKDDGVDIDDTDDEVVEDEEAEVDNNETLTVDETKKLREMLKHADSDDSAKKTEDKDDKTVQDVIDSMTEEQKQVMYFIVGQALENAEDDNNTDEGEKTMKHNIFDGSVEDATDIISHDELNCILADAGRTDSLKETFIAHGIENLDVLFPEAKAARPTPDMVTRNQEWVSDFWNSLYKSPFSRIKTAYTNGLTKEEARAKGYLKGNRKIEEQFSLLGRETTPQTVYKKQSLDRDDVIDITDIDIVAWVKEEMRMMLNEELCRAILVGDGRDPNAPDKIKEDRVHSIYNDADVYTIHYGVQYPVNADDDAKSMAIVDSAIKARKDYKGSGNPVFYATNEVISQMLLARDKIGRRMYKDESELASALRVRKIVEVPVLEGVTRVDSETDESFRLLAIIVNPIDYTVGADKGGAVSLFDDFDIDFNKMKYLIETRISGALTRPYSAIALEIADGDEGDNDNNVPNPDGE